MADPLGIIASVVAIATAAIRSSKALFELVDGIKRGPEEIKSISRDAHSFHSIVFSLNATLEDPSFTDVISGDDSMLEKVGNLARPLSDCEAVLSELMVKMQKQLKHGSDNSGDRMSFTNVKWCLFIKSEVRVLQLRLEAAKSTLNSALNGISMSGALPSFQSVELTDKPKTLWHAFVSHGFAIRRYVEESIDMGYGAHSSLQTTAGFSESVRDIDEQRNLIIPRKRMPDSNPPFYQETQDDIVSEYRSLSRHLAHIYHELAENRMLIQQLKQAESREASDKRLIAARYTNTHTPRDYLELRLENDSTEDLDSSASDIFFDCMSRVSMEDFFDVDMSHTTFSTSPHGYFEKSSSFYPEQYTVDGLFSHQIFVVSIKPSKNDYRTQMYFLLYAETPRKWRRIVVSAIFGEVHKRLAFLRDYAPENFEVEYKMLPKILETELNVLLPRLELFKSVTSLTLTFTQNESGQMIRSSPTKVREDLLEAQVSREDEILNNIEDLGCAQFLETEIIVQSRMSSSCFMVRVENRTCIERKAPFVRSGIDNENGFHNFFNDLKLLKSMRGCTGVAEFIGVVLDDTRSHLRSYLYEYPAHNILTVLVCAESKPEIVPWRIRETWARQIIKAVSEVHSNGYPVGGLLWLNDIGIRSNGTVLLTCLRTSQRYFQQGKGRVAPELFTASYTNTTTFMKRVTFRTEVFQLGLILWMLVEHKNNTAGLFCSKFGCTCYPRYRCTADHANPIELPPCSSGIPSYFNDIINQCRLRDPKMRPTACKLAESLPLRENDQPAGVEDILKRYARTQTFCLYCDECGTRQMSVHYSCRFCCQGDFDLCQTCFAQGVHCYNPSHLPVKRIIKADGTKVEAPD